MSAAINILSSPAKRRILRMVWRREQSAGQIARRFRVTFGAVSQHLTAMRRAGVIVQRRAGKRLYYRARPEALGPLAAALEIMWGDKLATLKRLAEAVEPDFGKRSAKPPAGRRTKQ